MPQTHYNATGQKVAWNPGEVDTGQYDAFNKKYSTNGTVSKPDTTLPTPGVSLTPPGANPVGAGQVSPFGYTDNPNQHVVNTPLGTLPGVYNPQPSTTPLQPGQYTNPSATGKLANPTVWQGDQNLQKISGAMMNMLGFDPTNGSFDTSSGSLMGGPGQAFTPSQLSGLYAKGAQSTGQNQRNATAGAAMSAAGRGTVGLPMSMLLGPQAQAANRGALASADLDAQMKGLDVGNTQYANRSNTFSNLLSGANSEANRSLQTQVQDAQDRQTSKNNQFSYFENAMNQMGNFMNQNATALTQNPGGKDGTSILANNRALLDFLYNNFNQAGANYNSFAM